MIELVFVRHGQPEWTTAGKAQDEPRLSALGQQEAMRVAERFGKEHFDYFFVSPLLRARETAAPLARVWGKEPTVIPWFAEFQAKKMMGWPSSEVDDYFLRWRNCPLMERFGGPEDGESFPALVARLSSGMDALLKSLGVTYHMENRYRLWDVLERDLRIMMVGHTFASGTTMAHLLGGEITPWSGEQFRMGWGATCSLVNFNIAGGFVWRLKTVDDRCHLAGLPCDDE